MNEPKSKPPIIEGGPNVAALLSPPALPIWAYNVACAVLLAAAAYYWFSAFALDNAHGAAANAAERLPCFIGGGALLICAFLCRVIVAIKRLPNSSAPAPNPPKD